MTLSEKAIRLIRDTFDTALYFAVMAVKENFRNYVGRAGTVGKPKPGVVILGNGPSLADDLPRLIARREYETHDFMAVNYFALDERFETVRPAYYVLSDPMFFRDSAFRERVAELYRTLDRKVTWPMHLYVQYYNPERFDYRAALPNPRIRIIPFHTQCYRGFRRLEFWLYRHGLGSANFGTVVQVCEYIALLLGYRTIELYGVDHTLLDGLCVDERNRLCRLDRHYYDTGAPAAPQPIFQKVPPVPYTMASYLAEVAELFRGHEVLRDYAARSAHESSTARAARSSTPTNAAPKSRSPDLPRPGEKTDGPPPAGRSVLSYAGGAKPLAGAAACSSGRAGS